MKTQGAPLRLTSWWPLATPLGKLAIPRPHHGFSLVLNEHCLAFEHDDELVLVLVPVTLAGDAARLERDVTDSEVAEAGDGPEAAVMALRHLLPPGRGIAGDVDLREGVEVELGHRWGLWLGKRTPPC